MDSRTKPQSGENIRADISMVGAVGSNAPVGKHNSFSITSSSSTEKVVGCCCKYTTTSQFGVGKKSSEGLLGDDDHGFREALFEISCCIIISLREMLRNC